MALLAVLVAAVAVPAAAVSTSLPRYGEDSAPPNGVLDASAKRTDEVALGADALPANVWAVQINARFARSVRPATLARLRAAGVNTLLIRTGVLRGEEHARLRRAAGQHRLSVLTFEEGATANRYDSSARRSCSALYDRAVTRCTLFADSAGDALRLARRAGERDVVIIHVQQPVSVRYLRTKVPHARIIAVATLGGNSPPGMHRWRDAIEIAGGDSDIDFAIAPGGGVSGKELDSYLQLVPGDRSDGPTNPAGPESTDVVDPASRAGDAADSKANTDTDSSTAGGAGGSTGAGSAPPLPSPPRLPAPPSPPSTQPAAKVTADLFVSTLGVDSAACTALAPCRTLERAYRKAQPGQVVEIAGGSYPEEKWEAVAGRTGARVLLRPASGAAVHIDGLAVYASHVEFRDLSTNIWYLYPGADDVTFRDVRTNIFFIREASNVSVIGGEVGPAENSDPQIGLRREGGETPTNILFDGVYFHDFIRTDPDAHTECLQVMAVNGLTIRNSRFQRCATHGAFISPYLGTIRNLLIENNWFDKTLEGHYALRVGACDNIVIRHNTMLQNMYTTCETGATSFLVESNIQPQRSTTACRQGQAENILWDWNMYESGAPCGPNDKVGAVTYRDRNGFDLHLGAGSAAIGRANPNSFGAYDFDGESRPLGGAPDAGADEWS